MKIILGVGILTVSLLTGQIFNVSSTSEFRNALENSSLNGSDDTIILAEGVYNTTDDGLGAFMFNDTEEYNLTIQSVSNATLDGNNETQVFNYNNSKKSTLKLKNLTIKNGTNVLRGAGVYANQNLDIENCNISENNNSGSNYNDGAICSVGVDSTTKITNSTISYNTSGIDGEGGGVTVYNGSLLIVLDSNISNNSSGSGGGIYAPSVEISNSIVSNNIANDDFGGGIYLKDPSLTPKIINSVLSDNTASESGGAIYVANTYPAYSLTPIIIADSKFSSNSANNKRTSIIVATNINPIVINSTFINNDGGIQATSKSYFINNTFVNNQFDNPYSENATLYTEGVIVNNIFDNNTVDIRTSSDLSLYNNYVDYTKIDNPYNYNVLKKNNLQFIYDGSILLNDDNITLSSSSPAINSGLNFDDTIFIDLLTEEEYEIISSYLISTDAIGNNRIHDTTVDMGAIEYGATIFNGTAPKILISMLGDGKVYSNIGMDLNISIENERSISELLIDNGNGVYTTSENNTTSFDIYFETAGEKTIKVKVVDNQGEASEKSLIVMIYDFTTQEAINYGKEICLSNPIQCGISATSSNITKNHIDSLQQGWHLLGTSSEINTANTDFFNTSKLVWSYDNSQWLAYSTTLSNEIENANINILENIPQHSGFWILKE